MSQSRTFKAGILASGRFLTTCVGLISAAVLARVLSVHDYATYRQTLLAYAFAAPLLALGLPQALYYFLPGENKRTRAVLVENLLLLSFMGGLFSLFLLLGGNRLLAWRFNNPDIAKTLQVLALYPLCMLPASSLSACLMARDRVKQVAIFNVLSHLFMLVMIITTAFFWGTPEAVIIATVVGAGIILLPALKLMFASCKVGSLLPSTKGMWSQLKYAVPLGVAVMLGAIVKSLDKIIVSSICLPEQFAVYINGALEIPLIGILTGSVTAVLLPEIVQLYKLGNIVDALELWKRAAVKCAIIILPAMCFLMVMAPEVIRTIFSAKYAESVHPFRIYLLLLPIRIVSWGSMLMAAGKNSWILFRMVAMLILNLTLSIILVRWIGYLGAALGTVIVIYIWSVPFNSIAISRLYGFPFWKVLPYRQFLKIAFVAIFAALPCMLKRYVPTSSDFVRLAVITPVYTGTVLVLMLRFNLVQRSTLIAVLRRIRF
ncbi:MAG: oligosaccharide flippase family protein [Planctomycetota bacterium]|jgi:O-antigen/teichoic acid export membrane protein